MKKLLLILSLVTSPAFAHGYYHNHQHVHPVYPSRSYDWVAPALIGGVIGYQLARPPVIVQQPQVIMQSQNCSPWMEIRNLDGTVTYTRTCQ